MKQNGIMNSRISAVVAGMGHTDLIGIVDAGFPVPALVERIDLAVKAGLPGLMDVLESLLIELRVEELILADELGRTNQSLDAELAKKFVNVKITRISHAELKEMALFCKAIIRTGECIPFSNVILRSGVIF